MGRGKLEHIANGFAAPPLSPPNGGLALVRCKRLNRHNENQKAGVSR